MSKFNVGDRVLILGAAPGNPKEVLDHIGDDGVVTSVWETCYDVHFDDGEEWAFLESELGSPSPPVYLDLKEALKW